MTAQGIGAAVKRREDFRFIKGVGKYTDDINLPNQTLLLFSALTAGACQDPQHRSGGGEDRAGRQGDLHQRGHRLPPARAACPAAGW